ncbi:MAG TPA: phosphatidylserine/phosphatidylglycerophosphate/cardiolipin synthase family protein [Candidatus Nesterenkonia stercoripullorum]|uniref:Phosphatidylserine/phosphatidylglycerophosphate/ cardiolipin synthase family protein n=1 Tax=Candidatus Nesterenkonia stercoripullorum TaxID=2838701 RepID=A0A9D1UU44_9MICC|nr:phosphatidylserine/phosphatidylglycerophosphate/cardiolipin synthase family protein [Candidatus Nesterenkonia stercoripullorum]
MSLLAQFKNAPLRTTFRYSAVAGGLAVGASAAAAAPAVVVDLVKRRNRQLRKAPRPGTFDSQVEQSQLRVFTDGATLYDHMIEAIDGAEHTVILETYIWKNDAVGQRFIDALNAAAARGVEVFAMYDGFANLIIPPAFYAQLAPEVKVTRVPAVALRFWGALARNSGLNHSKVMVIDDRIGFVGGYNIGSLYAEHWRDTHVREIGPAVWGLRNSVVRLWNEMNRPEDAIPWIAPDSWAPDVQVSANMPIQLVYPIRDMYLEAIERASRRIWITTAYFIPDQQILQAVLRAAQRGVDVRLMVPKESNHAIADWVSRGFYDELLRAGVTLLLFRTSMIHAKTATIDGEWSTVGTANIDRLSLSFNYETNVEIVDPDFAASLEQLFTADSAHCETLRLPEWLRRKHAARVAEVALKPLRSLL